MSQTLATEPKNAAEVEVTFDNVDILFPGEGVDNDPDEKPVRIIPTKPQPQDDLLDLSDESVLDKLASGGFMRIKPEGSGVISVALFKPAVHARTHYVQGKNKIIPCLQPTSDFCCKTFGEARDTVGCLCVQYGAASQKDGNLKKGQDVDLKAGYITLSRSALRTMKQSLQENQTFYSVDWKIAKRGGNAIGFEYFRQRDTPAYITLKLEKQVEDLIAPYKDGATLRKRIVKPMTLLEMKMLVTGSAPDLDGKLDDIETL
jgi:hypothetical protein